MTPYTHYAGILERKPGLIDLQIRNVPGTSAFRVWASKSISDLYGNPALSNVNGDPDGRKMLFEVKSGAWYISPSLRSRYMGQMAESIRHTTRALFNVQDFWAAVDPQPLPGDESTLFVALQHVRTATGGPLTANGNPILGPFLVVPPPIFFGHNYPVMTFTATAPAGTGAVDGQTPLSTLDVTQQSTAPLLALVLPTQATSFNITNNSGGSSLIFSFGWGLPFTSLGYGETLNMQGSSFRELIVAGESATVSFGLLATCARESGP